MRIRLKYCRILQHITYSQLQAAGMDIDNIDPSTLQMMNAGQTVAYDAARLDANKSHVTAREAACLILRDSLEIDCRRLAEPHVAPAQIEACQLVTWLIFGRDTCIADVVPTQEKIPERIEIAGPAIATPLRRS